MKWFFHNEENDRSYLKSNLVLWNFQLYSDVQLPAIKPTFPLFIFRLLPPFFWNLTFLPMLTFLSTYWVNLSHHSLFIHPNHQIPFYLSSHCQSNSSAILHSIKFPSIFTARKSCCCYFQILGFAASCFQGSDEVLLSYIGLSSCPYSFLVPDKSKDFLFGPHKTIWHTHLQ